MYIATVTEAEHKSKFYSQTAPHILPSRASYGLSIVQILKKKIPC